MRDNIANAVSQYLLIYSLLHLALLVIWVVRCEWLHQMHDLLLPSFNCLLLFLLRLIKNPLKAFLFLGRLLRSLRHLSHLYALLHSYRLLLVDPPEESPSLEVPEALLQCRLPRPSASLFPLGRRLRPLPSLQHLLPHPMRRRTAFAWSLTLFVVVALIVVEWGHVGPEDASFGEVALEAVVAVGDVADLLLAQLEHFAARGLYEGRFLTGREADAVPEHQVSRVLLDCDVDLVHEVGARTARGLVKHVLYGRDTSGATYPLPVSLLLQPTFLVLPPLQLLLLLLLLLRVKRGARGGQRLLPCEGGGSLLEFALACSNPRLFLEY